MYDQVVVTRRCTIPSLRLSLSIWQYRNGPSDRIAMSKQGHDDKNYLNPVQALSGSLHHLLSQNDAPRVLKVPGGLSRDSCLSLRKPPFLIATCVVVRHHAMPCHDYSWLCCRRRRQCCSTLPPVTLMATTPIGTIIQ